ncbi:Short-chain dehydrogenase/reductase SDR - like 4 [Theobroma cacao]|nr:Short-chain dehydrogenase/reductase SDR - like 4 [Theobroma cacao]
MQRSFRFLSSCPSTMKSHKKSCGVTFFCKLASKGITVLLTARDEKRGLEAVEKLKQYGLSDTVVFHQLDVADPASIASLVDFIKKQFGKLDILRMTGERLKGILTGFTTEEKLDDLVAEYLKDFKEGSLESKGWPTALSAYTVSKVAMNAHTRILAKKYPNFCINCVCPGHVKTDINFNTGKLTVEEGAASPVMLALLPNGGPSGLFFNRSEPASFDSEN